jgi:hypothetical protein
MLEDEPGVYYSLTKNLNNEIIITNGKDEEYVITTDGSGGFEATEGTSPPVPLLVSDDEID